MPTGKTSTPPCYLACACLYGMIPLIPTKTLLLRIWKKPTSGGSKLSLTSNITSSFLLLRPTSHAAQMTSVYSSKNSGRGIAPILERVCSCFRLAVVVMLCLAELTDQCFAPVQRRRMYSKIENFVEHNELEQAERLTGRIPNYEEYMRIRYGVTGVRMFSLLLE